MPEAETQTVIYVSPHILDESSPQAIVCSYKKCQTTVSIKPLEERKKFFSSLQFTPYQEIQENCIRVIDLPRKVHLQFHSRVSHQDLDSLARAAKNLTLCDDDGVSEFCVDLIRIHNSFKGYRKCLKDSSVQTMLMISPHLLDRDEIATIFGEAQAQTE